MVPDPINPDQSDGQNSHQGSNKNEESPDRDINMSSQRTSDGVEPGKKIHPDPHAAGTTFSAGELINDRYLIIRFIARGGMGEVYEVEDQELQEKIALKTLLPEFSEDENVIERFKRELQLSRKISHAHVCRVYHLERFVSEEKGAITFITMELLLGETLSNLLKRTGPLSKGESLQIIRQVSEALAAAHSVGIVHRDLKSSNIMFRSENEDRESTVVVTDFGLARSLTGKSNFKTMTGTGLTVGTPAYMAPEQVEGKPVTPATDVYALGVVLFEMVTGKRPFEADNPLAMAAKRLTEPAPSPRLYMPELDRSWERVIIRCLNRDPDKRYQTARDVYKDLLKSGEEAETCFPGIAVAPKRAAAVHILTFPYSILTYSIFIWSIVTLLKILIDRFILSPYLSDLVLVGLCLMMPTVVLLSLRGESIKLKKIRKYSWYGAIINLFLALTILFFLFRDKDLGSAQTIVSIPGNSGQTTMQAIPKPQFRKQVTLFMFEIDQGIPDQDWLSFGVPLALEIDLSQDLFVNLKSLDSFARQLVKAGYKTGRGVPLALKLRIARENKCEYILDGSAHLQGARFNIITNLYDSDSGKLLKQRNYEGTDLFTIIDQIAVQLKYDLEIPTKHLEEVADLPFSEVGTSSLEALKLYAAALETVALTMDISQTAELLDKTVDVDPTFAVAHLTRIEVYVGLMNMEKAQQAVKAAQKHSYRLTEAKKFLLNVYQLFLEGQIKEALAAAQRWHSLIPYDYDALIYLSHLAQYLKNYDLAIEYLYLAIDLEPANEEHYLKIADLMRLAGKDEAALKHLQECVRRFPDSGQGYEKLGYLHQCLFQWPQALAAYKKQLVIDPNSVDPILNVGFISMITGRFAHAAENFQKALDRSPSQEERIKIYWYFMTYYWMRGQWAVALRMMEQAIELYAVYNAPIYTEFEKARQAWRYVEAGFQERAETIIDEVLEKQSGITETIIQIKRAHSVTKTLIYLNRLDKAQELIEQGFDASQKFEYDTTVLHYLQAELHAKRAEFEEAIAEYKISQDKGNKSYFTFIRMGDLFVQLNNFQEAEKQYHQAIKHLPANPEAHLQLAKLLRNQSRDDEGLKMVHLALKAWSDADSLCKPALEARKLQRQLLIELPSQNSKKSP
ncbi:protein kinase [candidate division CSSED10-310 bacterium]|uniref:Protein kinase n=1 Tax=candidate division CSSED10-310 bacterium TaxID=2855610 RepID=A0ABV6YTY7_UNCC1